MMSISNPKRALYAQFAAVAKAMAHEHRLELLELVAQGEGSVESLAQRSGLALANVSQHLQHLRRAGLVVARRERKFVLYRVTDDRAVLAALAALRNIAERNLGEVNRIVQSYFSQRDALEAVSRTELKQRLQKGLITVLDVRPPQEFQQGHVPGARNVPIGQLKRWLSRLDRDAEIVAYCRGPYCVMAFEAVALLRARGFQARRLQDGFPEWRAAGMPVAVGA